MSSDKCQTYTFGSHIQISVFFVLNTDMLKKKIDACGIGTAK